MWSQTLWANLLLVKGIYRLLIRTNVNIQPLRSTLGSSIAECFPKGIAIIITVGETESQGITVTCLSSHSRVVAEPGLERRSLDKTAFLSAEKKNCFATLREKERSSLWNVLLSQASILWNVKVFIIFSLKSPKLLNIITAKLLFNCHCFCCHSDKWKD